MFKVFALVAVKPVSVDEPPEVDISIVSTPAIVIVEPADESANEIESELPAIAASVYVKVTFPELPLTPNFVEVSEIFV